MSFENPTIENSEVSVDMLKEREERLLSKFSNSKLGRVAMAGVLSLSFLAATPNRSEAGGNDTSTTEVSMSDNADSEMALRAEKMSRELKTFVGGKIKELNFFSKIGLIKEIRKNADGIRNFLLNDDPTVLSQAKDNLRVIIEKYAETLPKIKAENRNLFNDIVEEILDMVHLAETKSLSELKNDPRFK